MLPVGARLRRSEEFGLVVRRGRRAGRSRLVVHLLSPAGQTTAGMEPRAGFVVSKAVGNSVVRHRVTRRLRHLIAERLAGFPPGVAVVVRALPAAAMASSAELGADLDSALRKLGASAAGVP